VLNIAMAEIGLQGARIGALISKGIAAGMAELMRVYREVEAGGLAEPRHHLAVAADRKRRAALGGEDARGFRELLALPDSPMLLLLAGREGAVIKLGELIMILELHRQGVSASAIAR
jgi:hypothetical protein